MLSENMDKNQFSMNESISDTVDIDLDNKNIIRIKAGAMELQSLSENMHKKRFSMNESIADTVGIDLDNKNIGGIKEGVSFFRTTVEKFKKNRAGGDMIKPKVLPGKIENLEVKRRTNFGSEAEMLLFVFVVCNGDVDVMTGVQSSMTWYEEWFLYLSSCGGVLC